jgi:hypothetical protein
MLAILAALQFGQAVLEFLVEIGVGEDVGYMEIKDGIGAIGFIIAD